jgi:alkaline phosphatase D
MTATLRLLLIFILSALSVFAQKLESGPMLGYVEHREALVWIAVDSTVHTAQINFWKTSSPLVKRKLTKKITSDDAHIPVSFILNELDLNSEYNYEILLDGKKQKIDVPCTLKTKEIWEWRKDAPDFSFLYGSCAFRNDSLYDRPGKPYGQSLKIFESMAETPADFNLWNGDCLYFREADYTSRSGMLYRYSFDRKIKEQKKLLAVRPNLALWDDHDFGPNDSQRSFDLKDVSRDLFTTWWGNRNYGQNGEGIYSRVEWSDCDIYLLDDRWFRSANRMADSLNGQPNPDKIMFGAQQLDWLKNNLLSNKATFKFIVVGGQVVNPVSPFECLRSFPFEYNALLKFIEENNIEGVVFLTGDRHMTELIKLDRKDNYPLYDFTCSALTSGPFILNEKDIEFNNPYRVKGSMISENNYSRISVKGPRGARVLMFEIFSKEGKLLWQYSIESKELKKKH